MFFTKRCPSGGTECVSFELFLGILRGLGPGEGQGGAPGTVPLQSPEVTSRKACLRNADISRVQLGHTNRNVSVPHQSQLEIALALCTSKTDS